jgi:hypothetical protein
MLPDVLATLVVEVAFAEQQTLTASDGADGDNFGWSIAISGDAAVIGAYGDDDNGLISG